MSGIIRQTLALITLLLLSFQIGMAQTEAQASEEVMVFEKENTNRRIEVRVNDEIGIPGQKGRQSIFRGHVKRLKPNGFELINKKSGEIRHVNLNELESIHLGRRNDRTIIGALLLALGLAVSVIGGIVSLLLIAIAAITAAQIGGLILIPILGLAMVVIGAILIGNGNPRIKLRIWKWRLVRIKRVLIKRKK